MKTIKALFNIESDVMIHTLTMDTRIPGDVFFAIKGQTVNGHDYIDAAIKQGAKVIVHNEPIQIKVSGIHYVQVEDTMSAMHRIVQDFYDHPSSKMTVYGLTGTNGKTTTSMMMTHCLKALGYQTGYIGTLGVEIDNTWYASDYTTPHIIELTAMMSKMVLAGVTHVVMEVSSSALEQDRVNSIAFDYAGFTNLTHDHLDVHGTMETYFKAKSKLFEFPLQGAMIHRDDAYGARLLELHPTFQSFGSTSDNDIYYHHIEQKTDELRFMLNKTAAALPMIGTFNVENAACAAGLLNMSGLELTSVCEQFKQMPPISGRQVVVKNDHHILGLVDFAHSPDSIEKILKLVTSTIDDNAKVFVVTGSAGNRDALKRPDIARICEQYATLTILTEDDVHAELLSDINADMIRGFETNRYCVVEDRYEAIKTAIMKAQRGDAVVVLGKGGDHAFYKETENTPWMGDAEAMHHIFKNNTK